MRLSAHEIAAIKTAAVEAFGADAVVRLFGSRTRDDLRGGDIDLLIEVDGLTEENGQRVRFEDCFFTLTEPRKVDVLLSVRGRERQPIEQIAYRDGIVL